MYGSWMVRAFQTGWFWEGGLFYEMIRLLSFTLLCVESVNTVEGRLLGYGRLGEWKLEPFCYALYINFVNATCLSRVPLCDAIGYKITNDANRVIPRIPMLGSGP